MFFTYWLVKIYWGVRSLKSESRDSKISPTGCVLLNSENPSLIFYKSLLKNFIPCIAVGADSLSSTVLFFSVSNLRGILVRRACTL